MLFFLKALCKFGFSVKIFHHENFLGKEMDGRFEYVS